MRKNAAVIMEQPKCLEDRLTGLRIEYYFLVEGEKLPHLRVLENIGGKMDTLLNSNSLPLEIEDRGTIDMYNGYFLDHLFRLYIQNSALSSCNPITMVQNVMYEWK
jgi:hypothetical protein